MAFDILRKRMKETWNKSLERTDEEFKRWCRERKIPLHVIHHVVTWEYWDNGISVFLFLERDSDLEILSHKDKEDMKDAYLKFLENHGYPFLQFPKVVFEIDSDENVRKNFEGSYFFRLR